MVPYFGGSVSWTPSPVSLTFPSSTHWLITIYIYWALSTSVQQTGKKLSRSEMKIFRTGNNRTLRGQFSRWLRAFMHTCQSRDYRQSQQVVIKHHLRDLNAKSQIWTRRERGASQAQWFESLFHTLCSEEILPSLPHTPPHPLGPPEHNLIEIEPLVS